MIRHWRKINHLPHIIAITLIGVILFLIVVILGEGPFETLHPLPKQVDYGVSFSPQFAQDLSLDWQEVYRQLLTELQVKKLRLPTYWSSIEQQQGNFDFSQVDLMLAEASLHDASVLMVVGVRQPRWPECHIPAWAKGLTVKERQARVLRLIERVIRRYRDQPAIWGWQVENEPLFEPFGEGCDPADREFLKREVELVRKLDRRPIVISDTGELRAWRTPMRLSDIFGTTLYRTVYNNLLGYTTYPLLPYLYNLKSTLARTLFAPNNQKTIIVELQAEPWTTKNDLLKMSLDAQLQLFSVSSFQDNVRFAQKTSFDEIYLWGVEWWYYMRSQGHPEYWDFAKSLFND